MAALKEALGRGLVLTTWEASRLRLWIKAFCRTLTCSPSMARLLSVYRDRGMSLSVAALPVAERVNSKHSKISMSLKKSFLEK